MENKKIISAKSMTWSLIGWSILYGLCLNILYGFLVKLFTGGNHGNLTFVLIISLILQACVAHLMWYFSITSAFKKSTIVSSDLSKVINNLLIYTVILLVIYSVGNIISIDKTVEDAADKEFQIYDTYSQYLLSDEDIIKYQQMKDDVVKNVKDEVHTYVAILLICIAIINIVMVFVAKAFMKKYVVLDNNINPIKDNQDDINNGPIS